MQRRKKILFPFIIFLQKMKCFGEFYVLIAIFLRSLVSIQPKNNEKKSLKVVEDQITGLLLGVVQKINEWKKKRKKKTTLTKN